MFFPENNTKRCKKQRDLLRDDYSLDTWTAQIHWTAKSGALAGPGDEEEKRRRLDLEPDRQKTG